ncbi:MAG: VC0807 family protein [Ilumatobacteraceae bacterium]
MPYLVEATIIPTALFWLLLVIGDLRWALFGALAWTYGAVARRVVVGSPVPGLLILATVGITVRTIVYFLSRNDFVYFVQPIMRTTMTGLVFAGSVAIGRPLIARFAGDFCPLAADVRGRPGILRLFKRLTIVWALVNALAAASSLALLLTVPLSVFVVTAAVSAWVVTCTGVVVTVADSVSTARREGLITALSPDGRLYAATVHPV